MTELQQNLKHLMQLYGGLSVSDLAKLTGVPQPTLHHILMGTTKNPRKKSLMALAQFFSIGIQELIGEKPLPKILPLNIQNALKIDKIPIISWESLSLWPQEGPYVKEILIERKVSQHSFALEVSNDLLAPLFPNQSILIFDFNKKPVDRDFIVVRLRNKILFNRCFIDNDIYIKQELNNGNAELIKLDTSHDRIIGTLIESRIHY